ARANLRIGRAAEGLAELRGERVPVLEGVCGEERQLARPGGGGVAVDGDARAVGSAVAHLLEHRAQVAPGRALDLSRLREEPDDSAHMSSIYMCTDGVNGLK